MSIPEVVESDNITQLTSSSSTGSNIVEYKASTVPSEVSYAGEERFNLTFVDSPGYGKQTDAALVIRPIVEYHLNQFQKTDQIFVKGAASSQLMRFFNSGSGSHTHIDVCIYGILHRLKPVDVEYMRVLSPYTCIVPVILKSDSLRPTEIFDLKVSILETLMKTGISFYGFGLNMNELLELAKSQVMDAPPYAVSSPCVGKSCKFEGKEVVNEFETLKTNLLYNFTGDLRQAGSEKFVGWRQSRLNK